ncbi:hypothetical protein V2J09_006316 [Rumex salicifolius]
MFEFAVSFVFVFISSTTAQKYYNFRCSDNYTSGGVYQLNVAAAFYNLTSQASFSNYFTGSYGAVPNKVYSGYFCRGDVTLALCHNCLGNATQMVSKICPDQIAGEIWYDLCTVGYSPEPFPSKFVPYYEIPERSNQNITGDVAGFNRLVNETVEKAAEAAVADGAHVSRFGTREANFSGGVRVYALAQCSPVLLAAECRKCLTAGIKLLPDCCSGRVGGRVLISTCVLRYEIFPFYGVAGNSIPGIVEGRKKSIGGIVGGIAGLLVMILLLAICILIVYRRKKEMSSTHKFNRGELKFSLSV